MKPIQNWFNIPIYTYELLLYGFSWVVHGFWVLQNHQNGSDELLYIYNPWSGFVKKHESTLPSSWMMINHGNCFGLPYLDNHR